MPTQDSIAAGMDTTYVPQDVAHARHRAANQAAARKNLAAMICDQYGIDPTRPVPRDHLRAGVAAREFALLADALGLTEPTDRPGHCRCGNELPWSAATPHAGYHGQCRTCATAERDEGREEPIPSHPYASSQRAYDSPVNYSMTEAQRPCDDCGRARTSPVHRVGGD